MTSRPGFARAALTRFALLYWLLFSFEVWLSEISPFDSLQKLFDHGRDTFVQWVGHDLFGVSYEFSIAEQTGSGDRTGDWIWILCVAIVSVIGAIAWTLLDRRRARDAALREITRMVVRYTLGVIMFGYGIAKVFEGQFPLPYEGRLVQNYGDSSPMGLMWTFMGASPAYVIFAGIAETTGAVLVWFRRTTTLGALILGVVLVNVVMMNFCYDVPVKINSTHYLVMAVYLFAPDLRRLVDVLLLDRATAPKGPATLLLSRRWQRITSVVVRVLVIGYIAITTLKDSWPRDKPEPGPHDGLWIVTAFSRDAKNEPVAPDDVRWLRFQLSRFEDMQYAAWRLANNKPSPFYVAAIDDAAHTMTLTDKSDDKQPPVVLHFQHDGDDVMTFEGTFDGVATRVKTRRFDRSKSLLMSRGFHWINETPFNR